MIPAHLSRPTWVADDPLATVYRRLFAPIDWSVFDQRCPSTRGPRPHPPSAYLKLLVVKIVSRVRSIAELRRLLLLHPALVWEVGLHRGQAPRRLRSFPVARLVPTERWLRTQQQRLAPLLAQVLQQTVQRAAALVPDLDATTALDATHHPAWVKQNNENQSVAPRFQATCQPTGDPDCRLAGKTRHPGAGGRRTMAFWGYHSAVVTSELPAGALVLAATVQPAVAQEIQLVRPLLAQLDTTLGHPPAGLAADAAFDASWVWDWIVSAGGTAAIAPNPRGGPARRSPEGHPHCTQGLVMRPTSRIVRDGVPIQHYDCPLVGQPGATCPHPRFRTKGCHKRINASAGGLARVLVDRTSADYQTRYATRTGVERVFSQIKAWGLERPCARCLATVQSIVLAGYVTLNLHTLQHLGERLTVN